MREKWKDIDGFPGYRVSNKGNIIGIRGTKLKPVIGNNGYPKVTLCRSGKHVDKRINRLVASLFIPNPNNYPIVMHLDNDPKNNDVNNLSWGTHSENNKYCWDCGRKPQTLTNKDREKAYSIRRKPVKAININTREEIVFISQHDAARALGVSQQHIWGVLNGYRRSTGGYIFEYLDEDGGIKCSQS